MAKEQHLNLLSRKRKYTIALFKKYIAASVFIREQIKRPSKRFKSGELVLKVYIRLLCKYNFV